MTEGGREFGCADPDCAFCYGEKVDNVEQQITREALAEALGTTPDNDLLWYARHVKDLCAARGATIARVNEALQHPPVPASAGVSNPAVPTQTDPA